MKLFNIIKLHLNLEGAISHSESLMVPELRDENHGQFSQVYG